MFIQLQSIVVARYTVNKNRNVTTAILSITTNINVIAGIIIEHIFFSQKDNPIGDKCFEKCNNSLILIP